MKNTDKTQENILEVENLDVYLDTYAGTVYAVRDVSFCLKKGETLVTAGESGCGKSMTAKAVIGLLPEKISRTGGSSRVIFDDKNLLKLPEKQMRRIRGANISMIFQEPSTFLNPTMTIGDQIKESILLHKRVTKEQLFLETLTMLEMVNISNPKERIKQYPHEFSGGMLQRVLIAIALACSPQVLIADEPTTALDVTTQADIMELLLDLQKKLGTAVLLITHDLGIAAEVGDRIQIMYAGEVVETGTKEEIFTNPRHPYTWALLRCVPAMDRMSEHLKTLYSLPGTPPDLIAPPSACGFASRCEYCMNVCRKLCPPRFELGNDHQAACWLCHEMAPNVTMQSIL